MTKQSCQVIIIVSQTPNQRLDHGNRFPPLYKIYLCEIYNLEIISFMQEK